MLVTVCLAAIDCFLCRPPALGLVAGRAGRRSAGPRCGRSSACTRSGCGARSPRRAGCSTVGRARSTPFCGSAFPRSPTAARTSPASWRSAPRASCTATRWSGPGTASPRSQYWPIEIAAVVAVVLAALRRNWTVVLVLAAMALGWVVIEIAFALHGFPGVPRYLFEPAGLTGVLAGVAVGWLLLDASRLHRAIPRWAGHPAAWHPVRGDGPQAISQIRARAQGHLPRARAHHGDQQARRHDQRAGRLPARAPTAAIRWSTSST